MSNGPKGSSRVYISKLLLKIRASSEVCFLVGTGERFEQAVRDRGGSADAEGSAAALEVRPSVARTKADALLRPGYSGARTRKKTRTKMLLLCVDTVGYGHWKDPEGKERSTLKFHRW